MVTTAPNCRGPCEQGHVNGRQLRVGQLAWTVVYNHVVTCAVTTFEQSKALGFSMVSAITSSFVRPPRPRGASMTNVASSGSGASIRSNSEPSRVPERLAVVFSGWSCLRCPLSRRPDIGSSSYATECNASPISSLARCCCRSDRDSVPGPNMQVGKVG